MSWKYEIIRALFLTFGVMEMILNAGYLIKAEGLKYARKQHGELPPDLPDRNVRVKVVCMFTAGIAFFMVSLLSYVLHRNLHEYMRIVGCLFFVYGFAEALYYRYWKTTGAAIVTFIFFLLTLI